MYITCGDISFRWLWTAVTSSPLAKRPDITAGISASSRTRSPITIARSPTCLNAAYEPSAKPALTGTPLTVTLRSVRGIPTRKTSPAWSWPDLPSACSTAFQSGGAAWAAAGLPNRATNSATMTSSITRSLMVPPSDPLRLLLQHRVQPVEDRHTLRQELVIVRRRLGERPDGQVDAGRLVSGELAVAQVGLVHDL